MPNSDFLHSFVDTLNHALVTDHLATTSVMLNKCHTNKKLVKDSKVFVEGTEEYPTLSALSLLNSMINNYCGKKIITLFDEKGNVKKFDIDIQE